MTEPVPDVNPTAPRVASSARTHAALIARPDLVVCNECGAVHERITLARGTVARCRRCSALLGRAHPMRLDAFLAFAMAALLLIVIGNTAPIVTLDLRGVMTHATLPQAIRATWEAGQPLVALLTAATALVFPLCFTVLRIYVLASLLRGQVPRAFVPAMRLLGFVTRWGMVEVFMMGTLVAVVRGATLTSATPGAGLFAYAALTLLLTSLTAAGTHSLWQRAGKLGPAQ